MSDTIHSCHDQCQKPMCVLRRERDEARKELDALKATIEGWENKWKCAVEMAARAEADKHFLKEQLDAAIMLGKMQERRHARELEQVREQYRLSSVCRKLKEENDKLKQQQP